MKRKKKKQQEEEDEADAAAGEEGDAAQLQASADGEDAPGQEQGAEIELLPTPSPKKEEASPKLSGITVYKAIPHIVSPLPSACITTDILDRLYRRTEIRHTICMSNVRLTNVDGSCLGCQ